VGEKPGRGRVVIVEIKSLREQDNRIDGLDGAKAMAVRKWENADPDRLRYEMIFTPGATVTTDQMECAVKFVEEGD
jgi:hypothetical protein